MNRESNSADTEMITHLRVCGYLARCSGGYRGLRPSGHDNQTRHHTPSSSALDTGHYHSGNRWEHKWGTLLQKHTMAH